MVVDPYSSGVMGGVNLQHDVEPQWEFPKIRSTFLGGPRNKVGFILGGPINGNYQYQQFRLSTSFFDANDHSESNVFSQKIVPLLKLAQNGQAFRIG